MATDSKMLDIIRKIGDATPPPIRLSRIFQSPEGDFFSFSVSSADLMVSARVFILLAQSAVNIRFISEYHDRKGELRVQLCVDAGSRSKALAVFRKEEIQYSIAQFRHRSSVTTLSLYPFSGQPSIAERVFNTLRQQNIEILGATTATSVFSCVIPTKELEPAIASLKDVFLLQ